MRNHVWTIIKTLQTGDVQGEPEIDMYSHNYFNFTMLLLMGKRLLHISISGSNYIIMYTEYGLGTNSGREKLKNQNFESSVLLVEGSKECVECVNGASNKI